MYEPKKQWGLGEGVRNFFLEGTPREKYNKRSTRASRVVGIFMTENALLAHNLEGMLFFNTLYALMKKKSISIMPADDGDPIIVFQISITERGPHKVICFGKYDEINFLSRT